MALRTALPLFAAGVLAAACSVSQDLGAPLGATSTTASSSDTGGGRSNAGGGSASDGGAAMTGAGGLGLGSGGGAPGDEWAYGFAGIGFSQVDSVATDADNNVVAVGLASGPLEIGGVSYPAPIGANTAFVAKFDASGKALWAKLFGVGSAEALNVGVDASGNVLVGGKFEGQIDVGLGPMTTERQVPHAFIVVLAPDGTPLRQRSIGPESKPNPWAQATFAFTSAGEVALAMLIIAPVDPGNGPLAPSGASEFDGDTLLVKYDANLDVVFAKALGDADSAHDEWEIPYAVAFAADGDIVLDGSFGGTLDLGGGLAATVAPDTSELFLARFHANGDPVYLRHFGGINSTNLAVSPSGDTWLTGSATTDVDFGGGVTVHAGVHDNQTFLVGFDDAGNAVQQGNLPSGMNGSVFLNRLSTDAHGHVVAVGTGSGTFNLGAGDIPNDGETPFYAVFDATLTPVLWKLFPAAPIGGNANFYDVALDDSGHLAIGGTIVGKTNFGVAAVEASDASDPILLRLQP